MPREWHDFHAIIKNQDDPNFELNKRIVADRKPYFMRYIYPDLMKQYNTYIKNTEKTAMREYGIGVKDLYSIPEEERTDDQNTFLHYYENKIPVGVSDCVMNKICRRFEEEFDGFLSQKNMCADFDYTIMKSGEQYTQKQYGIIKRLYEEYNKRLEDYSILSKIERLSDSESASIKHVMDFEFRKECYSVCSSSKVLCDILLDICYKRTQTKRFIWTMCAEQIVANLIEKNGGRLSFPVQDKNGDIEFCGENYSVRTITNSEDYDEHSIE